MTSKKSFIKAAEIVSNFRSSHNLQGVGKMGEEIGYYIENSFVQLFTGDNPQFDEARFRAACQLKEKKK